MRPPLLFVPCTAKYDDASPVTDSGGARPCGNGTISHSTAIDFRFLSIQLSISRRPNPATGGTESCASRSPSSQSLSRWRLRPTPPPPPPRQVWSFKTVSSLCSGHVGPFLFSSDVGFYWWRDHFLWIVIRFLVDPHNCKLFSGRKSLNCYRILVEILCSNRFKNRFKTTQLNLLLIILSLLFLIMNN